METTQGEAFSTIGAKELLSPIEETGAFLSSSFAGREKLAAVINPMKKPTMATKATKPAPYKINFLFKKILLFGFLLQHFYIS
jgi:hypothetical protein